MPYFNGLSSVLECDVGVNDMCLLEELDEENFIDNLKQRFLTNQIYVSMPDRMGSWAGAPNRGGGFGGSQPPWILDGGVEHLSTPPDLGRFF